MPGFLPEFSYKYLDYCFYGVLTSLKFVFSSLQIFPGCFLLVSQFRFSLGLSVLVQLPLAISFLFFCYSSSVYSTP